MVTPHIYPEECLPVADGFVSPEIELPACNAVCFGKELFFPELPPCRRKLFGNPVRTVALGKKIHAWYVHVLVVTHKRPLHCNLASQVVFVQYVAGVCYAVFRTPVVLGFRKVFKEKRFRQFAVLPFYGTYALSVLAQE